jgi:hypothetical protein
MSLTCRDRGDGVCGSTRPGNLPCTWDRSVQSTMNGGMRPGSIYRNIRQDSASPYSMNFGVSDFQHIREFPSRVCDSSQIRMAELKMGVGWSAAEVAESAVLHMKWVCL